MPTMLAVLAYTAATVIPSLLLYRFGAHAWYWHMLTILTALGIGFVPTPLALANPLCELLTGMVFVFLMIWGIGGLVVFRPHRRHRERHA